MSIAILSLTFGVEIILWVAHLYRDAGKVDRRRSRDMRFPAPR